MPWRKVTGTILFFLLTVGLLLFAAPLLVLKLPTICCQRRRAVRLLPWTGLAYCGIIMPLIGVALGLDWWHVLIGVGLFALGGGWLLPDPFTYVFSPRKRRAVRQAIEYLESKEGLGVIYMMVRVVGSEVGRTIVSVPLEGGRGSVRRFLAVGDKAATIEDLDFEYVSSKHGDQVWL